MNPLGPIFSILLLTACSAEPRGASVSFLVEVTVVHEGVRRTGLGTWRTSLKRSAFSLTKSYDVTFSASPIHVKLGDGAMLTVYPSSYLNGWDGPASIPKTLFYDKVTVSKQNPATVVDAISSMKGAKAQLLCDYTLPPNAKRAFKEGIIADSCPAISLRVPNESLLVSIGGNKELFVRDIQKSISINVTILGQ